MTPDQRFAMQSYTALMRSGTSYVQIKNFLLTTQQNLPPEIYPLIFELINLSPARLTARDRLGVITQRIYSVIETKMAA
jgi:hypothetical protein